MKTKLLSLIIGALFLISLSSQSQTYSFSQLTSPYVNVTSPTVVTSPGWDDFTIIPKKLPFTFQFFGSPQDSLYVMSGFAAFLEFGEGNFPSDQIYFFDAELIERATGGTSDISISVTGTTPNRIYKVQTQNAGFTNNSNGTEYANVQLWLYEGTNVIEIHFGACSASAPTYNPLLGPTVGIYKNTSMFLSLSGPAANPSASSTIASLNITGTPVSGQVYRFTPGAVGLNKLSSNSAGMIYPNPSNGTINFRSSTEINNGTAKIFNSIGQLVYEKSEFSISKNQTQKLDIQLETGLYYLQISNQGTSFTPEKLIVK
jgi:hypothetical protein